jgi:hypothetical protein
MSTTLPAPQKPRERYWPSIEQQQAVADYFIDEFVGDATGVNDGDVCLFSPPRNKYFLGTLAPVPDDRADPTRDKRENNAMGFEMEVNGDTVLHVDAEFSVYYRIFPTYDQQIQRHPIGAQTKDGAKVVKFPLAIVYERYAIGPITLTIPVGQKREKYGSDLFAPLLASAAEQAQKHSRTFRRGIKDVPRDALTDPTTFEAYLRTNGKEHVVPKWAVHIEATPRRTRDGRLRVNVLLVNDSTSPKINDKNDDDIDPFLFRTSFTVTATRGAIVPIRLDLGPDAYRYDGRLAAYAMNCGIETEYGEIGSSSENVIASIRTVAAPKHSTFRIKAKDHEATEYAKLAVAPIPLLERFASDMEAYASDSKLWAGHKLTETQQRSLAADQEKARNEARRFREGIRWLKADAKLEHAFRLANETMIQLGKNTGKAFKSWRRFQLVAVVCELPTLAAREHPIGEFQAGLYGENSPADPAATATVIYFPTGGGKTETYLGIIACALFYDRLRGKDRGVTAICRFPLKVLTTNQCQRMANFVVAADMVRERTRGANDNEIKGAFELGLLIGGDDTPNTLSRDKWTQRLTDPKVANQYKVIERCPYCNKMSVEIQRVDPTHLRLHHVCVACGKRTPVMITDGEIFRYLPSITVGTIDKFAAVGLSSKFGALLGDVDYECSVHGFARGGRCFELDFCKKEDPERKRIAKIKRPLKDASPTLEVVDELHLLNEDLGAFDGHYETIISEIQKALTTMTRTDKRGVRMKIIATTATIKGEDRQIDHLFGLGSVVTPSQGPQLNDSFYYQRDGKEPLRYFVGVQPTHGMTAEFTVIRLLESVHVAIQKMRRDRVTTSPFFTMPFAGINDADFDDVCDTYRRSLTYMTSLVDFGKLQRSIPTMVNPRLTDRGYEEIVFESLHADTSREGIGKVREIVEDIESPNGKNDALIATSSVSHGVDIDRLNLMIFNGMPKSIAEYIQASSRVGRRILGIIFIVYNPVRERDRSHFRYHHKFHEYLDRMVAPVAINRWSKFAAAKTFPGAFMAYVLQVVNRHYWENGGVPNDLHALANMQAVLRGNKIAAAQTTTVEAALEAFYMCTRPESANLVDEIKAKVREVLANLRMAASNIGYTRGRNSGYQGTPEFMHLEYAPMTSLRDVEEGVNFYPIGGRRS